MKHIELVIPTIGRFDSLFRTIQSFYNQEKPKGITTGITVVVDWNRISYFHRIMEAKTRAGISLRIFFNSTRFGWNRSLNKVFAATDHDFYINGSDDLTFERKFLFTLHRTMTAHFPDGDGVVGVAQNLKQFCPAAFAMIGRKFINRFPDRQLMYPYYQHFCGDSELWHFSKAIGKFYFCPAAKVIHDRPMDEGKKLANKSLRHDREIWWRKKGKPRLYWGNSFLKPSEFKNEKPCRTW